MHGRGLPRVRVQGERGLCADTTTKTIRWRRKKSRQQTPTPNTSCKNERCIGIPRCLTGATTEAGNKKTDDRCCPPNLQINSPSTPESSSVHRHAHIAVAGRPSSSDYKGETRKKKNGGVTREEHKSRPGGKSCLIASDFV